MNSILSRRISNLEDKLNVGDEQLLDHETCDWLHIEHGSMTMSEFKSMVRAAMNAPTSHPKHHIEQMKKNGHNKS